MTQLSEPSKTFGGFVFFVTTFTTFETFVNFGVKIVGRKKKIEHFSHHFSHVFQTSIYLQVNNGKHRPIRADLHRFRRGILRVML